MTRRIVDASSTDWTLPESRKCWKCAKDLVWSTEDTVLTIARIYWLEVDVGISNVHLVCQTCAMADQPILDWNLTERLPTAGGGLVSTMDPCACLVNGLMRNSLLVTK